MKKLLVLSLVSLGLTACSGMRETDQTFEAHAESFNILFLQIPPRSTHERAMELVPKNADIKTVEFLESDTTSYSGFMNRLLGLDRVKISGTKVANATSADEKK